jgi:hypothetical protein
LRPATTSRSFPVPVGDVEDLISIKKLENDPEIRGNFQSSRWRAAE